MKKTNLTLGIILLATMFTMSGCEVIGDIFKAGMWVGVIIVVAIVALILWLVGKARK